MTATGRENAPRNAVMVAARGRRTGSGKASKPQKIDVAMCGGLAHEAVCDAIAAGDLEKRKVRRSRR
jgi:hypothetical protein